VWTELRADHPLSFFPKKNNDTAPKSMKPKFRAAIVMSGPRYPILTIQSLRNFVIP